MDYRDVGIFLGFAGALISISHMIVALVLNIIVARPIISLLIQFSPGLAMCILVVLATMMALKEKYRIGGALMTAFSAVSWIVFGGWFWILILPIFPSGGLLLQYASTVDWIMLSAIGGLLLLSHSFK